MTRRPGRPPSPLPRRVPLTTTQPAPLVAWLKRYSTENKVPMAQVLTRALLELRQRIEEAA